MNYNVVQNAVTAQSVAQGNYEGVMTIASEWGDNLDGAIKSWHDTCRILSGDEDTYKYKCVIMDNQLDVVGDFTEFVDKGTIPTPPEPTE